MCTYFRIYFRCYLFVVRPGVQLFVCLFWLCSLPGFALACRLREYLSSSRASLTREKVQSADVMPESWKRCVEVKNKRRVNEREFETGGERKQKQRTAHPPSVKKYSAVRNARRVRAGGVLKMCFEWLNVTGHSYKRW